MTTEPNSPSIALHGTCRVCFAFDLGYSIDLDQAERAFDAGGRRDVLRHRRRAPRDFQYRPLPLRLTTSVAPFEVEGEHTEPQLDIVVFDFAAAALTFTIPLAHSLSRLVELSDALYDHEALTALARTHAAALLDMLGPAVTRPRLSDLVEDYVCFHVRDTSPDVSPDRLIAEHEERIAQILRAETSRLSRQEIDDALSVQVRFGTDDVALIDWSTSLIFDPEPNDAWPILEFATVQLLELRLLDDALDDALERSFDLLTHQGWRRRAVFGSVRGDLRQIVLLQAESASGFEAVQNALKLLSDQFLARLHRAVASRFHLQDWRQSIRDKLDSLDGIYGKISDQRQAVRLEILEWIIIILIAVSIVLQIVAGGH